MGELSDRTIANMESVLDQVCRALPNGGDHECRKQIALKLKERAESGGFTLRELRAVAQSAVKQLSSKPSA